MNVKLGLSFNYINKVRNLRVRVRLRGRIQITLFLNFPFCCHTVQEEARSRRSATTGWLFECNSPSFSLSLLPPQCNFLLSLSMSIHCLYPPHEELHFSINSSQCSTQQPFSARISSSSWLLKTFSWVEGYQQIINIGWIRCFCFHFCLVLMLGHWQIKMDKPHMNHHPAHLMCVSGSRLGWLKICIPSTNGACHLSLSMARTVIQSVNII